MNAKIVTQYQPIAPITMHPAARAISVTQLLVSTMPHWPLSPSYDINRLLCVRYVICYPTTLYLTPVSGHMTISPLALRVSTGVVPRSLCLSIFSSKFSWLPRWSTYLFAAMSFSQLCFRFSACAPQSTQPRWPWERIEGDTCLHYQFTINSL